MYLNKTQSNTYVAPDSCNHLDACFKLQTGCVVERTCSALCSSSPGVPSDRSSSLGWSSPGVPIDRSSSLGWSSPGPQIGAGGFRDGGLPVPQTGEHYQWSAGAAGRPNGQKHVLICGECATKVQASTFVLSTACCAWRDAQSEARFMGLPKSQPWAKWTPRLRRKLA